MNIDKFTTKSQSVISKAQFLATDHNHPQVESLHLLQALLIEDQSVIPYVAQQGEIQLDRLTTAIDAAVNGLPIQTSSGETYMGREAAFVLQKAIQLADQMKDDYVATEHLLLALLFDKGSAGKMLNDAGFNQSLVKGAIESLRKGRNANTSGAENTYNSLDK